MEIHITLKSHFPAQLPGDMLIEAAEILNELSTDQVKEKFLRIDGDGIELIIQQN